MSMHSSNPILDTNELPTSSTFNDQARSKQSVILDGVRSLSTSVNNFSRMTAFALTTMGLMTLANFGTTIAALLYVRDLYVDTDTNVLVNENQIPIATATTTDIHDVPTFPTYDSVLQSISGGMAVSNGTMISKVSHALVDTSGDVDLYDMQGEKVATVTVENVDTIETSRHLTGMNQKFSLLTTTPSHSRVCPTKEKPCYDVWKRECIVCGGNTNTGKGCWTSVHCPTGWACDTSNGKCVERNNVN